MGGGILVVLFEGGTSAHCEQYHSLGHIEGERLLCIRLSLLSGYGYDMNICFEVLTCWLPCHYELYPCELESTHLPPVAFARVLCLSFIFSTTLV